MTDKIVWQFSTENDASAHLIRWFTRSEWSHVDAVLPDGRLLGARIKGGVQIREPGYASFTKTIRYSIATPVADKFYEILQTQIGKPYDWRAIAAFGFGNRDWRNTDAWFCSEYQIWTAEQAKYFDHPLLITVDKLSPRDQLLLFSPNLELIE